MSTAVLTIDDISSRNTPAIVDYLKEKGIRPILFAVGVNVEKFYDEAVYAVKSGAIVGNHSYSHPAFSTLTLREAIEEIEKCEAVLDKLYKDSGVLRVHRPFRFPYGDKGGKIAADLQEYLKKAGFSKADDSMISYDWWKNSSLSTDIDTFWTFDFEEYRLPHNDGYTQKKMFEKIHDPNPRYGAPLLKEGSCHFILMHAHDETDAVMPGYYKTLIDHALDNGVRIIDPAFV